MTEVPQDTRQKGAMESLGGGTHTCHLKQRVTLHSALQLLSSAASAMATLQCFKKRQNSVFYMWSGFAVIFAI